MVAITTGCATRASALKNYPPAYQAGAADGCGSGGVAAGDVHARSKKDIKRYLNDDLYKMGYDDKFAECKGRHENLLRMLF